MPEILALLRGLQGLDHDLYQVRRELRRLPEERDRRRASITSLGTELEEVDRKLLDLRTRVKEIEDLTTSQRQRVRKLEGEAASSRGDTALLMAFQHEMRTLRRQISEAEEEGLGLVEESEGVNTRRAELAAAIEEAEAEFAEYAGNVEAEIAAAQAKLEGLEAERKSKLTGEGVSPDVLDEYEKLLEAREGQAMAMLEGRICQGCYTEVPSNIYVRLARGTDMVNCPSCRRILYLPD